MAKDTFIERNLLKIVTLLMDQVNVMCCFSSKNVSNYVQMISFKGKKLCRSTSYIILSYLDAIL